MADDGDQVGWDGVKPDRMGQLEAEWAGWKGKREEEGGWGGSQLQRHTTNPASKRDPHTESAI